MEGWAPGGGWHVSRGKVHSQPQRLGTFSNSPWQHFSGNLKTGKFCLTWHRLLIFPDILMFSISLPPCKAAALIFPYAFSIVVRDSLLCTVEKSLLVHSHCSCSKLRVFFFWWDSCGRYFFCASFLRFPVELEWNRFLCRRFWGRK